MYPEPVHYEVDGTWKEIDNTLVSTTKSSGNIFTTSKFPFMVQLPTNTGSEKRISVSYSDYTISFALEAQQSMVAKDLVARAAAVDAGEEKILSTSKINSSLAVVRNNVPSKGDTVYSVATPTLTTTSMRDL